MAVVLLLTASLHLLQADDSARAAYNWSHPNEVTVAPQEMTFTSSFLGAPKNESIYVWVYSPQGTVLIFCMFHIEAPLIDRWGIYMLVVDPGGEVHWVTGRVPTRLVSYSETRLMVSDGSTAFTGADGIYHLTSSIDEVWCDLSLTSRMPAWKPGTGRVNYTPDGLFYQTRILVVPWAYVSGTITVDGVSFRIDGHGLVEKTRFSNPLTRFAPYFQSLKLYHDDQYLYLLDVTLSDAYDNRVVSTLGFAHADRWLFTARDYVYTVDSWSRAGELPNEYPSTIRIDYEADGFSLNGVYQETRRLWVTDVFEEFPRFVRSILGVVLSRPIYVRSVGTFAGTLTTPDGAIRPLNLSGTYEYAVVR